VADEVVRRLTISATANGVDQASSSIKKLADESANLATVTDTNAKRALSAEDAFKKLTGQIDDASRAQMQIEKGTRTLNDALAQGVITQEQYNRSLGQLNDKYGDVDAANDNVSKGFRVTGLELMNIGNHVRQAAGLLYVFNTAFRTAVNEAAVTGLGLLGSTFGALGITVGNTAKAISSFVGPALASFLRLAGPIALLYDELKLIEFAWKTAGDQIEKYSKISETASQLGVTPDFLQRYSKAWEDTGGKIDDATEALKKFNKASQDKLGGSDLGNKLDSHLEAGNLDRNVRSELEAANGLEAKLRVARDLVTELMNQGKSLAALDIASTFATDRELDLLRENHNYFVDIQRSAEGIADTQLVSAEDLARATNLKSRYDEAVRILGERWIPFQNVIIEGGMTLKAIWVSILEIIGSVLGAITSMAQKIGEMIAKIPGLATGLKTVGSAALNLVTGGAAGVVGTGVNYLSSGGSAPSVSEAQMTDAKRRLGTALNTKFNPTDTSNELGSRIKEDAQAQKDAVDRAIDSINRHIKAQEADAKAVGASAAEHARLRVEAQQEAAIAANGGEITEEQAKTFDKLKKAAGEAAGALEAAKVSSEISRGEQTLFLSPREIQIANQLKGLFGDDIPAALGSSQAAALRMNMELKAGVDALRDAAGGFAKNLITGLVEGKSLTEALTASVKQLSSALINGGISQIMQGNFLVGGAMTIAGVIGSLFTDDGDKAARAAREKAEQQYADSLTRRAQYNDDAKLAGIDQSTLQGQLQAFDIRAAQMRQDEVANGNYAIVELEHKLAAEREAIVKKSNEQISKSLNDFLNSIKTGPLSVLSPEEQLKFLQGQFSSDLAKAQGGDTNAINNLTKDASSLLDAAKSYYGSSGGYVDTYNAVTSAITGLASGNLIQAAPDAGAYSTVGSTPYGDLSYLKPSVSTTSSSFTPPTSVTRTPSVVTSSGSDNVAGVIAQGFNGSTQAIVDAINGLGDRIKRVEDATKQGQVQRRLPGSMAA
jgi:hypothetical protein